MSNTIRESSLRKILLYECSRREQSKVEKKKMLRKKNERKKASTEICCEENRRRKEQEKCFWIKLYHLQKDERWRMKNNKFVKLEKSVYKNKITVNNVRDFLSCLRSLFLLKYPPVCRLSHKINFFAHEDAFYLPNQEL